MKFFRLNYAVFSTLCSCFTVAVVVAFIICWAPFHAQRLLAIYGLRTGEKPSSAILALYTVLTYTSGILYYLSATINPILYNIMSNRFRRAFKVSTRKNQKKTMQYNYLLNEKWCISHLYNRYNLNFIKVFYDDNK